MCRHRIQLWKLPQAAVLGRVDRVPGSKQETRETMEGGTAPVLGPLGCRDPPVLYVKTVELDKWLVRLTCRSCHHLTQRRLLHRRFFLPDRKRCPTPPHVQAGLHLSADAPQPLCVGLVESSCSVYPKYLHCQPSYPRTTSFQLLR